MGCEEVQVRGYPEFVRTAQSYHGRPIFALFCGDKDAEGRSWCPDCVSGMKVRYGTVTLQKGAVLGYHTQDTTERVFLFVLEKKLAFTPTQVQSAFEHVINSEKLVDSQMQRNTAEPVVRKELHNLPDDSVFIYCLVGDRAYWKDPNNEFRRNLKLTGVPTLLKYGTPQKLVEEECVKAELVHMLFTED